MLASIISSKRRWSKMLAFSIDYYGVLFRATQSVGLFCTYGVWGEAGIKQPQGGFCVWIDETALETWFEIWRLGKMRKPRLISEVACYKTADCPGLWRDRKFYFVKYSLIFSTTKIISFSSIYGCMGKDRTVWHSISVTGHSWYTVRSAKALCLCMGLG